MPIAIKRKALDAPHSAYALLENVGFMVDKFNGVTFDWWCISANRRRKSRTCKTNCKIMKKYKTEYKMVDGYRHAFIAKLNKLEDGWVIHGNLSIEQLDSGVYYTQLVMRVVEQE